MVQDSFFKRWADGSREYGNSIVGQLDMKKWFMRIVIIGLVGGGVQRFLDGDFWMFLVLWGFAGIMIIDYRNIMRQLNQFRRL